MKSNSLISPFHTIAVSMALICTATPVATRAEGQDAIDCIPLGGVYSQQFCFDGSRLLVAHDDVALLWDVTTGKEIQRFEGHQIGVRVVLFSPDGTQVLTAGGNWDGGHIIVPPGDTSARLWDAATGKEIRRFEGSRDSIHTIEFSSSARRILTADGQAENATVRVWDVGTGKQLLKVGDITIDNLAGCPPASLTPDGRNVVARRRGGRQVCVWDIETGAERVRFNSGPWFFYTAVVDPSGKIILTACGAEPNSGDGPRGAFQGGKYVVIASTQHFNVRTWNANTGQLEHVFQGHTDYIQDAAFSADGKAFVTASSDGTVRLWPTALVGKIRVFRHGKGAVLRVFLSPDQKRIFTEWTDQPFVLSSDHGSLWDVESGKELRRFGTEAGGMVGFSPDSRQFVIASSEGCATVLSAETGAIIRKIPKFARRR